MQMETAALSLPLMLGCISPFFMHLNHPSQACLPERLMHLGLLRAGALLSAANSSVRTPILTQQEFSPTRFMALGRNIVSLSFPQPEPAVGVSAGWRAIFPSAL
jgi:hypothetical protein